MPETLPIMAWRACRGRASKRLSTAGSRKDRVGAVVIFKKSKLLVL